MPDSIRDGTGTSNLVEVDSEHNLHSLSVIKPLISHRSEYDGSSYGISTPMRTITATGGRVLWLRNDTSTKDFYFTDFWFNWNGGSTNFDRPVYGQLVFGDTMPTTNITTSSAGSMNRKTTIPAEMTVLCWNETGDGMTGHVAGTAAFYWCNGQGAQHYDFSGSIIIGKSDTISVNLRGEEIGEASVNILGFFK